MEEEDNDSIISSSPALSVRLESLRGRHLFPLSLSLKMGQIERREISKNESPHSHVQRERKREREREREKKRKRERERKREKNIEKEIHK